jgi:membrane-associated phospholipid phosphatase
MVVSAVRRPAALALFVLVLVLGAALLFDGLVAASIPHFKSPILNALVGTINPIGSGVTLLVVCLALAVMSRRIRRPRLHDAACISALAFASAGLIEFSLKHLVGRPRPDAALASAGLLGPSFAPDIDSFPSGHATSVFAVATVFAAYYPRLRWPLYALAAAIALGRVYLARHYVSDIIAGAVLGTIVAACLYRHRQALPGGITLEASADRSD